MLEFKLNYYFEKYKDYPLGNALTFRKKFVKDEGEFPLLRELILMIVKYQTKKYGETIDGKSRTSLLNSTIKNRDKLKLRNRFGSKTERVNRKLNYQKEFM